MVGEIGAFLVGAVIGFIGAAIFVIALEERDIKELRRLIFVLLGGSGPSYLVLRFLVNRPGLFFFYLAGLGGMFLIIALPNFISWWRITH